MQMQRAYLDAFLKFGNGMVEEAVQIAQQQLAAPLPAEWTQMYTEILSQAAQVLGTKPVETAADDRHSLIEQLASGEAVLQLTAADGAVNIYSENMTKCSVNFYRVDIELLFSNNPFLDR